MTSRAKALNDFYDVPVWKAHREAANATMIDSDNVERRLLGFLPLGTGILGRRRPNLGDQLDHEVHPSGATGSHQPRAACLSYPTLFSSPC